MLKNKKLITIIFAAIFIGGGLFYAGSAKAACTLQSVSWSKQTVGVGENVNITVGATTGSGQDCLGRIVTLNIKEKDTLADDFIKTISVTFNNNPFTAIFRNFSFTRADFLAGDNAGEGAEEEMYIEAVIGGVNAVSNEDTPLILLRPGSEDCILGSARFEAQFSAAPILGSPLNMIVNASQCAGIPVSFTIYSDDVGPSYEMDTVSGTFDSGGTSINVVWTANNDNDSRPLSSRLGNYDFYFIASAGTSRVTSNTVKIPANSENGCVNCNNVPAPNVCVCADGFSMSRGTFSSCNPICSEHIGDAHGSTGGGLQCNDNEICESELGETSFSCPSDCPVAPGGDQTFDFSIPNPLQANNFLELIDVIATWLFNLAIPVVVVMIVWSGVLFLTSQGDTGKVGRAKQILMYAVVGFAIILIGKGFITLIESILNLGAGP